MKAYDTEDKAYTLCTFKSRDLQCDFNSPFWEEHDCAWYYSQSLMHTLGFGPMTRFQRVKDTTEVHAAYYWRRPDAKIGNAFLKE